MEVENIKIWNIDATDLYVTRVFMAVPRWRPEFMLQHNVFFIYSAEMPLLFHWSIAVPVFLPG